MTIQDATPAELRRDPASDLRFAAMRLAITIEDCRAEGRPVPQPISQARAEMLLAVTAYDEAVRV